LLEVAEVAEVEPVGITETHKIRILQTQLQVEAGVGVHGGVEGGRMVFSQKKEMLNLVKGQVIMQEVEEEVQHLDLHQEVLEEMQVNTAKLHLLKVETPDMVEISTQTHRQWGVQTANGEGVDGIQDIFINKT
jgi:hypothetical protein